MYGVQIWQKQYIFISLSIMEGKLLGLCVFLFLIFSVLCLNIY